MKMPFSIISILLKMEIAYPFVLFFDLDRAAASLLAFLTVISNQLFETAYLGADSHKLMIRRVLQSLPIMAIINVLPLVLYFGLRHGITLTGTGVQFYSNVLFTTLLLLAFNSVCRIIGVTADISIRKRVTHGTSTQ